MTLALRRPNPDDPVTRHMHQDYTTLDETQTVAQALVSIRQNPPRGRIIYFYVLDGNGRLRGVVPTRRLLLAAPETTLAGVMVKTVVSLPEEATVLDACEFFIQHRLLALPIIDKEGRLKGTVDMELYTDEIGQLTDPHVRDDLFQLIGVHATQSKHGSPLSAFRSRFPWLGCNIAAGMTAAFLTGAFQAELEKVVALAFFIAVVLNLAESVSSQSVSLALQMLHGQRPTWRSVVGRIRRELATGLFLGLASGAVVSLISLAWLGDRRVALCLIGGITGGVTGAAALGLALPMLLHLFRLEPRVAAGPIALAGADVLTIVLYLNLARWLLG